MTIKWQPFFKAKTPILFQWYIFEGEKEKYFNQTLKLKASFTNGRNLADEISYDLNELTNMEETLASKVKPGQKFLRKYLKLCYQYSDRLIKTSKNINKVKEFRKLDGRKLLALYEKYQKSVLMIMPFMTTPMVIDNLLKKKIFKLLGKEAGLKDRKEKEILLSKLIVPKKKSFFVQETESLLNMALKLQKNKSVNIEQDIQKHLEKFTWTSCHVYLGKFQTKKDIEKKIKKLLKEDPREKLAQTKKVRGKTLKNYQKAFIQIRKSKKLLELVDLAREFLYLQTYKMDVLFIAHYFVYPLLEEIGKRLNLKVDELVYLTGEEIIDMLKGEKKIKKIETRDRMKSYALIKTNNKFTVLAGEKVKRVIRKTIYKEVEVRGTIANKGRATGKAKLVYDVKDIHKVNKGDIIVSPMTEPKLVPAIVMAAGIITDFGGLLCHAAIISREFGMPCVVGTKKATKIFRDDDLIELNAYEGIARKLGGNKNES